MKYEEFEKHFKECRQLAVEKNQLLFTAIQIKQPIEDFQEVYDFIFAEDYISRTIIDEIVMIEPTKQVDFIFVPHII